MAYSCPGCGLVSHHPKDEAERFCGRCNAFAGDRPPATARYIMEDRTPVWTTDVLFWAEWMNATDRVVAYKELHSPQRVTLVETFFMGASVEDVTGRLTFFATRCARGPDRLSLQLLGTPRLYETWDAAEVGHRSVVELLLSGRNDG